MQTVSQRLALLRQRMALRGLDACVVVTDDFHGSEYVGDHFKTRAYLSGFTGSAGTLLVLAEEAYLWTDGRYFLQAERQLTGSGIELMRAGQPGVPTLSAFLAERLPEGGALGFDGRTVSTKLYRTLEKALAGKRVRMDGGFDPAEGVWSDRPPLSAAPVWAFDSGVTRREKLALLRQDMTARDASYLLLTDLTDAAWTLELRGGDVACTPVFLGFLLLGREEAVLCAQAEELPGGHSAAAGGGRRGAAPLRGHIRAAGDAARRHTGHGGQRHGQRPHRRVPRPYGVAGRGQPGLPPQGGEVRRGAGGLPPRPCAGRRGDVPVPVPHENASGGLHGAVRRGAAAPVPGGAAGIPGGQLPGYRRLRRPRRGGSLRAHGGDGRAAAAARAAAGGQRRALPLRHHRCDPHRGAGRGNGAGAPHVHAGAAGTYPAGHGAVPAGRHGGESGRAGADASVGTGTGLRPRHRPRRGLRAQRPRVAAVLPLAVRGGHTPPGAGGGNAPLR